MCYVVCVCVCVNFAFQNLADVKQSFNYYDGLISVRGFHSVP